MTKRRRVGKKIPRSAWITFVTAIAAAVVVLLQPILSDYGIDLQKLLSVLLGGQTVQTAVYPSDGTAEVHFIDVGQASCILIKGSEKTMLIDAGEAKNVTDITDYLAANGVVKIDYFINTHPHADHMGGCRGVMEAVPTSQFIMTDLKEEIVPTTVGYQKLIDYLSSHKDSTAASVAAVGDLYELGGGLRLEVLGPVKRYDDLNDTSIVLRMDFGESSFLFTGDMEATSQRDILLDSGMGAVDLLSAPHHGSSTSIDKDFMGAISPATAVISCGRDNDYGHPHKETLQMYDEMGIECFRTDRQGSIVAITDGSTITITTEREG